MVRRLLIVGAVVTMMAHCGTRQIRSDIQVLTCTVADMGDKITIACPDESKAVIVRPPAPINGTDGIDGKDGRDGKDGENCVTIEHFDGAVIQCGQTSTFVRHGTNGTNGINGTNCHAETVEGGVQITCGDEVEFLPRGTDGKDGRDGKDGTDGINGKDGIDGGGCSITAGATGAIIECLGTTVTIPYPTDGKDGVDGQDGQDGEGCSVADVKGGAEIICADGSSAVIKDGTSKQAKALKAVFRKFKEEKEDKGNG